MYLMTSSLMTQNGRQYAINHLFDKLDPEQDFPLTVHQTTVVYQHVFKQVHSMIIHFVFTNQCIGLRSDSSFEFI